MLPALRMYLVVCLAILGDAADGSGRHSLATHVSRPSSGLPDAACAPARPVLAIRGGARDPAAPEAVSWYEQAGDGDGDAASSEALRAVSIAPSATRIIVRALYLAILFTPMLLTAPLAYPAFMVWFRVLFWYPTVCRTLAWGGAAWIKWAQWASTRPDMFPEQLCAQLARLQTEAPVHSFGFTKRAIEEAFCAPMEATFDAFPNKPIASGSIAQVSRRASRRAACGVLARGVVIGGEWSDL